MQPIIAERCRTDKGICKEVNTMKRNIFFGSVLLTGFMLAGCSAEQDIRVYSISFPFIQSNQGWTGGFSEYPSDSTGYHLHAEHDTLPYNINADSTRKAFRLSGNSLHGSLFMFIKRKVEGLQPNTMYQVLYNIRLASNLPSRTVGAEPTQAEHTYLKAGATTDEPEAILTDGVYQLNVNKGEPAVDGTEMVVMGNIAVASSTVNYTLISRYNNSGHSVMATTDATGALWLLVGTDTAVPGKTTLYYTQIDVLFNQAD